MASWHFPVYCAAKGELVAATATATSFLIGTVITVQTAITGDLSWLLLLYQIVAHTDVDGRLGIGTAQQDLTPAAGTAEVSTPRKVGLQ